MAKRMLGGLVLGAALAAALAPAPRAATVDLDGLRGDVSRPDDFKRFVEGSRVRRDDVAAPREGSGAAARSAFERARLASTQASARPAASVPAPSAAAVSAPAASRGRGTGVPTVPDMALAAVLGLGLMLVSASFVIDEIAPARTASHVLPDIVRPHPIAADAPAMEFAPALARAETAARLEPFVDARMPAPTWRAISAREQALIESWDASPEKAQGRASLLDWLDARGAAAGDVDTVLLRAKLERDA